MQDEQKFVLQSGQRIRFSAMCLAAAFDRLCPSGAIREMFFADASALSIIRAPQPSFGHFTQLGSESRNARVAWRTTLSTSSRGKKASMSYSVNLLPHASQPWARSNGSL